MEGRVHLGLWFQMNEVLSPSHQKALQQADKAAGATHGEFTS